MSVVFEYFCSCEIKGKMLDYACLLVTYYLVVVVKREVCNQLQLADIQLAKIRMIIHYHVMKDNH